jgi:hypothetical protein
VIALLFVGMLFGAWLFGYWLDLHGYLIARGGDTPWAQIAVYGALTVGVVGAGLSVEALRGLIRRRRFLAERLPAM